MRASLIRTLAIDVFARCVERRESADRALQRAVRSHPELHSNERRLVGDAAYAMLRHQKRLDHLLLKAAIAEKVAVPDEKSTPERHKLRFAAALVDVVGQTLTDAATLADADPDTKKVLARLAAWKKDDSAPWPTEPAPRLALRSSMPEWFARRLLDQYGPEAEPLAASLNLRAPLALRANLLVNDVETARARLKDEGINARPGRFAPHALVLDGHTNTAALQSFKDGAIEVQDEGSQCIAAVTQAAPGLLVVDACAGAGGKTLALAAVMGNKGRIVACDVTPDRLEDVKPRARRAKAQLIEARVVPDGDDRKLKDLKGRCDVVLVDAPCSGTGAWRRTPDARLRLTEKEADEFPPLQRRVLHLYATLVKPGGILVYATCSILRGENEDVVAVFSAGHPEFKVEPVTSLPKDVLDAQGRLVTLPHRHNTDGFFACVFRRVK